MKKQEQIDEQLVATKRQAETREKQEAKMILLAEALKMAKLEEKKARIKRTSEKE